MTFAHQIKEAVIQKINLIWIKGCSVWQVKRVLRRSKMGSTLKCLVNTIAIKDLHAAVGDDEGKPTSEAFNWKQIQNSYKRRHESLEDLNIYGWCIHY